jgi:hypothetical protein
MTIGVLLLTPLTIDLILLGASTWQPESGELGSILCLTSL